MCSVRQNPHLLHHHNHLRSHHKTPLEEKIHKHWPFPGFRPVRLLSNIYSKEPRFNASRGRHKTPLEEPIFTSSPSPSIDPADSNSFLHFYQNLFKHLQESSTDAPGGTTNHKIVIFQFSTGEMAITISDLKYISTSPPGVVTRHS
jgi:hypothetical protein